jgi:hypothetical protein
MFHSHSRRHVDSKHLNDRNGFASIQKMVALPQVADVAIHVNVNGIGRNVRNGIVTEIETVTENVTEIVIVICEEDMRKVPDIITVMTMKVTVIVEITDEKEKGRRTKNTKNGTFRTDNPDITVKKSVKALDPTLGTGKMHLIARRALSNGRDTKKSYPRIQTGENKGQSLLKRVKYRGCLL